MKNRIKTQLLGILGVGSFTGMAIADNGGAGSGVISRTGEALQSTVATIANVGGALGGLAADRLLGDVSGSVSFGYDTEYFYRGVELGSDPFWVGADLSIPITEGLSFNPGIWYINPSGGNDLTDEIDYYVSLDWIDRDRIGSVSLKYRNYSFPEAGGSTNEVGLGLGYNLAGISFAATGDYDFDLEAEYYELSAGTTVGLSDRIAISAGGIPCAPDSIAPHRHH